jgi:heme/copper-type cytochrome/quinol oxidase subunit 2
MLGKLKLKFHSGLVGIFIGIFIGFLFGIIIVTIYKGLTSPPLSIEQLTMLTTTIMALATIILAIITGWYAYTTYEILDEQRKLRQISDIDKKLEMLYQPLENLFKISTDRKFVKVNARGVFLEPDAKTSFEENNVYSYLHLASIEIKEFLQIIMTGLLPEDSEADVFFQMYDDTYRIVTNEIDELKNERTILIG